MIVTIMTPEQVRTIRLSLRLTQVELANQLRVSRKTVQNWEAGRHPVSHANSLLLSMLSEPEGDTR